VPALRTIASLLNKLSLIPILHPRLDSGYSKQSAGPTALAAQIKVMRVDHFKVFLMAQERGANRMAGVRASEESYVNERP
jgi:hypothetical protein